MLKRLMVLLFVFLFCHSSGQIYGQVNYEVTSEYAVARFWLTNFQENFSYHWHDMYESGLVPYDRVVEYYGKGEPWGETSYGKYLLDEANAGRLPLDEMYYHLYMMYKKASEINKSPYAIPYFNDYVCDFDNPFSPLPEKARKLQIKVKDGNINYFSVVGPMISSMVPVFLVAIGLGLTILLFYWMYCLFHWVFIGGNQSVSVGSRSKDNEY